MTAAAVADLPPAQLAPLPAQRTHNEAVSFMVTRCEAYPQPFSRCTRAHLFELRLDVEGDDGQLREGWELVKVCKDHRGDATTMVLARIAGNRRAVLTITPTNNNGEVAL